MRKWKQAAYCGVALTAMSCAAMRAQAQDAPPADDGTASSVDVRSSPASEADQEEIVVTAQKREQNINDVGLTITALGGAELKNRRVASLEELAAVVPSLSYANSHSGTPVFTMRGVGFYETSLGAYPTVSVYLDEVPLPFPALTRHSAFDLGRMEVLKGPQGTLFGQNATGGAVNYIAAKPTRDFAAGLDLSYGRFNEATFEGFVSGPLAPNLKGRLAARLERGGAWQESNSRPGDTLGKARNFMGRLLLDYQPADSVRLQLNLNGWKDKSDTQAPQFVGVQEQQPGFLDPDVAATPFSPQRPRAADWTPGLPVADLSLWQAALRADIDVMENATLTSITSYVDYTHHQGNEAEGLPQSLLDIAIDDGRIKSFSQELRLANSGRSAFRWVVGANYESSSVFERVGLEFPQSGTCRLYTVVFGYRVCNVDYNSDQEIENYAAFGNIEYDVTDQFTLKGGVRYTRSNRKTENCSYDDSGDPIGTGPFFYTFLLGGALGPYTPDQCITINSLATDFDGVPPGFPVRFKGRLNEDNISWRAGVDWKPGNDVLVYANISKGYKAGSFPTISATALPQYFAITQESVLAFEGGFKVEVIDRLLQLNGAAYHYRYRNKQLRSKFDSGLFGILDVLQNIPKSHVNGAELELNLTPSQGSSINAAVTYTDAKVDEFVGINAAGVEADFAGTAVPFTPKWQISINGDQAFDLSAGLRGFLGASVSHRSKSYAVIGGNIQPPTAYGISDQLFAIDAYATVDVRAGVGPHDESWRLQVWGRNIFNKYYWNNVVAATDVIVRYPGRPASYGLTLNLKYR